MDDAYETARSAAVLKSLPSTACTGAGHDRESPGPIAKLSSDIAALRGELQETEDRLSAEIARQSAEASASFLDIYKHQWIMAIWTVILIVLLIKLI